MEIQHLDDSSNAIDSRIKIGSSVFLKYEIDRRLLRCTTTHAVIVGDKQFPYLSVFSTSFHQSPIIPFHAVRFLK